MFLVLTIFYVYKLYSSSLSPLCSLLSTIIAEILDISFGDQGYHQQSTRVLIRPIRHYRGLHTRVHHVCRGVPSIFFIIFDLSTDGDHTESEVTVTTDFAPILRP